ncbi:MAG: hypothetical protein KTR24_08545 [Saprospiraceae bacterium]|nr:hypothetical protein [Saprospiraceae bacterium]
MILRLLICIFLLQCGTLSAQRDSLFFTNSQQWDEERYPNVQGTPYFFEDFMQANIMRRDSFVFSDVLLNYNGFSQEFEIREDDRYIVLEALWYLEIRIPADKNPSLEQDVVFRQDMHPTYKAKFAQVLHDGQKVTAINDFKVEKSEKTIQNVGGAVTFERFVPIHSFRLIRDGEIDLLRPKKDVLAAKLGSEKEFSKFLKANKIKKLTDPNNMAKAVAWYDELLSQ